MLGGQASEQHSVWRQAESRLLEEGVRDGQDTVGRSGAGSTAGAGANDSRRAPEGGGSVKRLPGSRKVERSLKKVRQETRAALKELNQHAGRLMSRGDYLAASELAERGRVVSDFEGRLDALRKEWRALWGTKEPGDAKDAKTPLWEFYQPILEALSACGGDASRGEIENRLPARPPPPVLAGGHGAHA